MSQSHLQQLRAALTRRGWKIIEKMRGDDGVEGAATWELRRGEQGPTVQIDFGGFGGMGEDISLAESYGCNIRGQPGGLYFRRVNRSREVWEAELAAFVESLDAPSPE